MDNKDLVCLAECRSIIEKKLNWTKSSEWKLRDYEYLSQKIHEETGILLSVSTLRRIWKKNYNGHPHPATLDALAGFVGSKNWNNFKSETCVSEILSLDVKRKSKNKLYNTYTFITIFFSIIIVGAVIYLALLPDLFSSETGPVSFSARTVLSDGIPNTVVYQYDLAGRNPDSLYITESWLPGRKFHLDKSKTSWNIVKFHPGFVKAELVVDGKVLGRSSYHLKTDDWISTARQKLDDPKPTPITQGNIKTGGRLYVSPETLNLNKVKTDSEYSVSFYNVREFNGIDADNFQIETSIKNSVKEGGIPGQYTDIIVLCENGRVFIPAVDSGYVGNIYARFSDLVYSGNEKDLSIFGCDMSEWNIFKYRVVNKSVVIERNDREIYNSKYNSPLGKVMGIHIIFFGSGSVDFVKLRDETGQIIYEDNFDN